VPENATNANLFKPADCYQIISYQIHGQGK